MSRRALNVLELWPTVGYLHEFIGCQTKQSLVYDLQEPYRWLVDATVISCVESGCFGKKDFYRMDNYVLRLKPEAVKRFIDALRIKFNSPVQYKGKFYSWDTLIRLRAQELANYVVGKRTNLDFGEPKPVLHRTDSEAIRNRILSMTTADANKLGIRKNTLWYIQQHVKTEKSFRIYRKIRTKLSQSTT
jgi:CRISPR-associated protein Cas1